MDYVGAALGLYRGYIGGFFRDCTGDTWGLYRVTYKDYMGIL